MPNIPGRGAGVRTSVSTDSVTKNLVQTNETHLQHFVFKLLGQSPSVENALDEMHDVSCLNVAPFWR